MNDHEAMLLILIFKFKICLCDPIVHWMYNAGQASNDTTSKIRLCVQYPHICILQHNSSVRLSDPSKVFEYLSLVFNRYHYIFSSNFKLMKYSKSAIQVQLTHVNRFRILKLYSLLYSNRKGKSFRHQLWKTKFTQNLIKIIFKYCTRPKINLPLL